MSAGGVYLAVFYLPAARRITVGRLGSHWFDDGVYVYVGSAQRSLAARLERHARRRKTLRWHIDYLSVQATMLGAIVLPGPKAMECRLAAALADRYACPAAGFGASDCRCPGHLFHRAVR